MTAAVVVGGGSGIGAAVVDRQRLQGAEVLVWDLGEEADVRCDITDATQVDHATAETLERIGVPTLLTVTAGIGHSSSFLAAQADDWDKIVGTNAKGVWLVMRAVSRHMLDNGGGSIVTTSSVSARLADKAMGLYCVSKAALDMVIAVAALEWAPTLRVKTGGAGSHRHGHARTGAPGSRVVPRRGGTDCPRTPRHPRRHRRNDPGSARHTLGYRSGPYLRWWTLCFTAR